MVRPATSMPRFGKTISRSSVSPAASNCGDTNGLPTWSLNLAFMLSMRHSTRATSAPSTSFVCTMRLSGTGSVSPGGGGIASVFDFASRGCSSGTLGSMEAMGGAVLVRVARRLRPSAGSSPVPDAPKACIPEAAACLRPSSMPTFFLSSRVSFNMSAMSLEIWPLDRSSFCTRELIACTCVSRTGATWHACVVKSAKGMPLDRLA
mmetsp:Transcript_100694/g.307787  ORF Transcript_100694/g.307787 Transcript_100694/m.307787 type:complete len:206 (-) Transcript_100694:151-768(-)